MISRKYILFCLTLWSIGAWATTQFASQPTISPMETGMRSTSAFLAPKTVATPGSHAVASAAYAGNGANTQSFSPLHTTLTKKKNTVKASRFIVSNEVTLSASAIAKNNWENLNTSGSTATNPAVSVPGPRKVGGGDNPEDPYWGEVVPVGDIPFVFFALLAAVFCLVQRNRAKQKMDARATK